MEEENISDGPDPKEEETRGAAPGGGGEPPRKDEPPGDETPEDALWEPGLVRVEFRDGVEPETKVNAEDGRYEIQSLAGQSLSGVNQLLARYEMVRAAPTFQMPREEAAKLRGVALQQGLDAPNLSGFVTLYFGPGADVERIARELAQFDEVKRAAPVPRSEPPRAAETDELLGSGAQLPRQPTGLDHQWYIFRCRADRAWRLNFTGKGVVLADIDWGFEVTHVEMENRLHPQRRHNSVDGGSGVSFGHRIDHGTAVMGIAGAGRDGRGMVGFAHAAELWPVQANAGSVLPDGGQWVRALEWVLTTDSGGKRKVALLENQGPRRTNFEADIAVSALIRIMIANGVVVCVPAGNGDRDAGLDVMHQPIEPTGSILVGATKYDPDRNERLPASNWGPRVVVSAPGDGEHDLTCNVNDPANPFKNEFGGTSGAAAKVAGAAALMLEANPYIRHSDLREILRRAGTHVVTEDGKPVGRFLDCEAAVLAARLAPAWGVAWRQLPGNALDLVFAPDGTAWHLGSDRVIYRWDEEGSRWLARGSAGDAVKLAVGASGRPWYVAAGGDVFRMAADSWEQVPGPALDLGVGSDGSIWRVGNDNGLYQWRDSVWEADGVYGSAVKVDAESANIVWHVGSAGDVYRRVGDGWQQVPGQALDISVGADGSVWRVGPEVAGDGNSMSRWGGAGWEPIDGAAAAVAVAPNGLPWHVNRSGDIFRRV